MNLLNTIFLHQTVGEIVGWLVGGGICLMGWAFSRIDFDQHKPYHHRRHHKEDHHHSINFNLFKKFKKRA